MKIKLDRIKPNSRRDFGLYPIDEQQVQRLVHSIDSVGFFSGVTLRPIADGYYETAAGHHRIAAARQGGLTEVDAIVHNYTDWQLVQIAAKENLTQYGNSPAAVMATVTDYIQLLIEDVILGEGDSLGELFAPRDTRDGDTRGGITLEHARSEIIQRGPGLRLLYRAINGFAIGEHGSEIITRTSIEEALTNLKIGGKISPMIAGALAKKEAREAARVHAEQERQAAAAEAQRRAEEAEREAELKKKRDAEIAAAKRAEAEANAKAEAEAKARRQEREEAEARAEAQRKRDAESRAKEAAAAAERQRQEQADAAERAAKQRAAEREAEEAAAYDLRCVQVFRLQAHSKVFREFVLFRRGVIPKDKQYDLALAIRAKIDQIEKETNAHVGASAIEKMLEDYVDNKNPEQTELELKREHVTKQWEKMQTGGTQAIKAFMEIEKLHKDWPYDQNLFPMPSTDIIRSLIAIGERMKEIQSRLGLDWEAYNNETPKTITGSVNYEF